MRSLAGLLLSVLLVAADEAWEAGSVVLLGDNDFASFQEKNPSFLAAFYAPWCGHCKALKAEYAAAAETLQFRVPLVGVDCTADGKDTCAKFDVTGFPTLLWFSNGQSEAFEGGRTAAAIVAFVEAKVPDMPENFEGADFTTFKLKQLKKLLFDRGQDCIGCTEKKEFVKKVQETIHLPKAQSKPKKYEGPSTLVNGRTFAQERRYKAAKEVADKGWEENGQIVHLVDDDFETFRQEKGTIFAMFYTPWCGHCKNFKPVYAEASKSSPVPLVALDCETNPEICRKYGATSYPTLKLLPEGDKKGKVFDGARTAAGLVKWLTKKTGPDPDAAEEWTNVPAWEDDNGEVVHMTGEHWETYRKTNPKVFVLFYAPWCGHCKAIKPDWADLSKDVKALMPILAVDCTEHAGLCSKYEVKGYPTIKYFSSSVSDGEEYQGGRSLDALVEFVKGKAGKQDL